MYWMYASHKYLIYEFMCMGYCICFIVYASYSDLITAHGVDIPT